MADLAIDRFHPTPDIEARAREIVASLRSHRTPTDDPALRRARQEGDRAMMLGWLTQSVALFLEQPRLSGRARTRLAVDLRVVQLMREP